uniref:Tyrosine-protein phosphatase domain-containing protein n=1 Tax=Panagrolaimus davidi TaxID=227884 RepID=A0A914R8X8_9BILA
MFQWTAATLKLPGSSVSDNIEGRENSSHLNKPSKISDFSNLINYETENEESKKQWEKNNYSNAINGSTLSLHIADDENSVETDSFNEDLQKRKSDSIKNEKRIFTAGTFVIQNAFEFPRQENERDKVPEVSKFKSSQRLLNPNKASMNATSIEIDEKILDDLIKVPVPRIFKEFKRLKHEPNYITNVAFDNNKRKNRYNIPVADDSRCILKSGTYVNANHVTSGSTGVKLIAAEAPKKETVEAFFQLLFDHDVSQIIMLCAFEEDGNEKCYQYLKGNNQHQISKNFGISCCEEHLVKFEKSGAIAIIKVSKLHLTNT